MSYDVFKRKVEDIISRAGGGIRVRFSTDSGNGTHRANCSDGTMITGNKTCKKVTISWGGKNHQSMALI